MCCRNMELTDAALESIQELYAELRDAKDNLSLPITVRSLETIVRLATAAAKARMSEEGVEPVSHHGLSCRTPHAKNKENLKRSKEAHNEAFSAAVLCVLHRLIRRSYDHTPKTSCSAHCSATCTVQHFPPVWSEGLLGSHGAGGCVQVDVEVARSILGHVFNRGEQPEEREEGAQGNINSGDADQQSDGGSPRADM